MNIFHKLLPYIVIECFEDAVEPHLHPPRRCILSSSNTGRTPFLLHRWDNSTHR